MPDVEKDPVFVITKTGKARVSKRLAGGYPTQAQLAHFVEHNREKITSLTITPSLYQEQRVLDFEAIGQLPNLQSLILTAVDVNSLIFTQTNTPSLKVLKLCELESPRSEGPAFALDLPQLETLEIYHIRIHGPCDFGQSLSRCPKLKIFLSRKLWFLPGPNLTVLPNCVVFRLIRSEGTRNLEILFAPKLEELAVNCCYEMTHLRLWDLPYEICAADVERLQDEYEKEEETILRELRKRVDIWKDGSGGQKAFEKGWIEEQEVAGFDFDKAENVRFMLDRELNKEFEIRYEKAKERVWDKFVAHLSQNSPRFDNKRLPICDVDCGNTFVDKDSKTHLEANDRVIDKVDEDDME